MKKRVIAAILGVMLSLSMGLEAGAAALDSGFESGFTAEQTAEEQLPESEGSEEVQQPSEEQDTSEGTETDNTSDSDGFISGEVADEDGSGETEPVQNFDEAGQNVTQENQTENVQATVSGTVFEHSDWEEPESGRFRLHKKTVKLQAATEAEVSVQSSDLQEAEDAQIGTLPEDAAQTTEVGQSSFQDQYYTAADGIVELTIKSEKGALHKGYYLFDTNGYLVTGEISLNGTESQGRNNWKFLFYKQIETAESYKEYASEGVGLKPWTTNHAASRNVTTGCGSLRQVISAIMEQMERTLPFPSLRRLPKHRILIPDISRSIMSIIAWTVMAPRKQVRFSLT